MHLHGSKSSAVRRDRFGFWIMHLLDMVSEVIRSKPRQGTLCVTCGRLAPRRWGISTNCHPLCPVFLAVPVGYRSLFGDYRRRCQKYMYRGSQLAHYGGLISSSFRVFRMSSSSSESLSTCVRWYSAFLCSSVPQCAWSSLKMSKYGAQALKWS